jgi:hypothetical protein
MRDEQNDAERDDMVRWMERNNVPMTRDAYLAAAFLGQAPEPLDGEHETELPSRFQKRAS